MQAIGVTLHGGFAQYLTVSERCVFDIGNLGFTEATLIEPLACVVHGHNNAQIPLGSDVLIFGGGPIGLLHAQIASMNGASTVTVVDPIEVKLDLAKTLGVNNVFNPEQFNPQKLVNHYMLVIDCTGVPKVIENAIQYVKNTGTLLMFGVCAVNSSISINPYEIYKRELHLVGSFALKKTFGCAVKLAQSGKINLKILVDQHLTLEECPELFEKQIHGYCGFKTVIYPNGIKESVNN
jgi:2-desacetyl-2-hydroxyethyl bacteriochlorophyllide A dehydrogenase